MKLMHDKKGEVVLRNIVIMVIIFAAMLILISLFVIDMSGPNNYDNQEMLEEYEALGTSTIGTTLLNVNLNETVDSVIANSDAAAGSVNVLTGVISGAGAILKAVITAPIYIGNALTYILTDTGFVPNSMVIILKNIIASILYIVIGFVIVSALLRGGRV